MNHWNIGILLLASVSLSCSKSDPPPHLPYHSVKVLVEDGGRVSWSPDGEWIAFDQEGKDGYFDVYLIRPDGTGKKCLTCDKEELNPQKHMGTAEWHPSGDYLVFTVEQEHDGGSNFSRPGQGVHNEIWVMTSDGSKFWQLTDLPDNGNHGSLHPHFSKDGTLLSWGEMYNKASILNPKRFAGSHKLCIGDFSIINGEPKLTNVWKHDPDIESFYENHGFSDDNSKLLFTSSREAEKLVQAEIYTMDVQTKEIIRLTDNDAYNEHAQFVYGSTKIIWMSNKGIEGKGTEYFIMNADGSNPQQLTFFNQDVDVETFPRSRKYIVADNSLNEANNTLVAYIKVGGPLRQKGFVALIELK